jgi:hypothetical protein
MTNELITLEIPFIPEHDKGKMALSIVHLSFDNPIGCSFLSKGAVNSCSKCPLNDVCEYIDSIVEAYKEETTAVVETFYFQ